MVVHTWCVARYLSEAILYSVACYLPVAILYGVAGYLTVAMVKLSGSMLGGSTVQSMRGSVSA